jgi:hypothetical protein
MEAPKDEAEIASGPLHNYTYDEVSKIYSKEDIVKIVELYEEAYRNNTTMERVIVEVDEGHENAMSILPTNINEGFNVFDYQELIDRAQIH